MAYVGTARSIGSPVYTLASVLQGEAGREGPVGMQAVANVISNRAASNFQGRGTDVISQATSHAQFQGQATPGAEALDIAQKSLDGQLADVTHGAVYYANPGDSTASWARRLGPDNALQIGNHFFTDNTAGVPFNAGSNVDPHGNILFANGENTGTDGIPGAGGIGSDFIAGGGDTPTYDMGSNGITSNDPNFSTAEAGTKTQVYDIGNNGITPGGEIDTSAETSTLSQEQTHALTDTSYPNIAAGQEGTGKTFKVATRTKNPVKKPSRTIPQAIDLQTKTMQADTAQQAKAIEGASAALTTSSQLIAGTAKNLIDKTQAGTKNLFSRGTIVLLGIVFVVGGIWLFNHPETVKNAFASP